MGGLGGGLCAQETPAATQPGTSLEDLKRHLAKALKANGMDQEQALALAARMGLPADVLEALRGELPEVTEQAPASPYADPELQGLLVHLSKQVPIQQKRGQPAQLTRMHLQRWLLYLDRDGDMRISFLELRDRAPVALPFFRFLDRTQDGQLSALEFGLPLVLGALENKHAAEPELLEWVEKERERFLALGSDPQLLTGGLGPVTRAELELARARYFLEGQKGDPYAALREKLAQAAVPAALDDPLPGAKVDPGKATEIAGRIFPVVRPEKPAGAGKWGEPIEADPPVPGEAQDPSPPDTKEPGGEPAETDPAGNGDPPGDGITERPSSSAAAAASRGEQRESS